ncbi:hypothetical protein GCM10023115_26410 [Pontixanthobacter gangjinensis]
MYNAAIVLEDGQTKTIVDLIIKVAGQSTAPTFDYSITPADGQIYELRPNDHLTFDIKASDSDAGDLVSLSAVGLPTGTTFNPPSVANPVQTSFSWTPTASQLGTSVINFIAQDLNGVQTLTSITIVVSLKPEFDVPPTLADAAVVQYEPGTAISLPIQASDPDTEDLVQIVTASLPAGASIPALPSTAANPTSTTVTWNPVQSDWGIHPFEFTAQDSYEEERNHAFEIIVNSQPSITSAPVTSVVAGTEYTYQITATDPDIPYGDALAIKISGLPSWLSYTDNGDGTATLSGTPTFEDVGTYQLTVFAEDIYHHGYPNPPQNTQIFDLEVSACNIEIAVDSYSEKICPNSETGYVNTSVTGGTAPFTYSWENSLLNTSDISDVPAGKYVVTVEDGNGCTASAEVTILEEDNTPPTLTTKGATVILDADGNGSITAADVIESASDACGIDNSLTTVSQTSFTCADINVDGVTVDVTVYDSNGNDTTEQAVVTVVDNTAPALTTKGATVILDADGNGSITAADVIASENDACGIDATLTTVSQTSFTCSDINADGVTVDVTVYDNNGNDTTEQAVVTVVDNTDPALTTKVATVILDADGNGSITAADVIESASDACGIDNSLTTVSQTSFTCVDINVDGVIVDVTVYDNNGNDTTEQAVVTVVDNTAPALTTKGGTVNLDADGNGSITAADVIESASDACGINNTLTTVSQTSFTCSDINADGVTVDVTVYDNNGNPTTKQAVITVQDNIAPVIATPVAITQANDSALCGAIISITPPGATDNCSVGIPDGTRNDGLALDAIYPVGTTTITWNVMDHNGNPAEPVVQTVAVTNNVPVITNIQTPLTPVSVESFFALSANVEDNNLKAAQWYFSSNGDFTDLDLAEHTFDGEIVEGNVINTFNNDSFNPQLSPGVYSVKLLVTDHCEETAEFVHDYVVIYDPNGGFVTGGGWIESPENAYTADPTLTGRANFGFNAKYKSGKNNVAEVDGKTNFQFKAGDLHFKSSSHEDMSLVISGSKATYRGIGSINGHNETYKFLVTVIDGELTGSSDIDRYRIKIWNDGNVIYDNNIKNGNTAENADPATAIAGGSIVIHKPKNGGNNSDQSILNSDTESILEIEETMSIAPNPIQSNAVVQFSLNNDASGVLCVYDYSGRMVGELYRGEIHANEFYEVNFYREGLPSGYYIFQLKINNGQSFSRIAALQ